MNQSLTPPQTSKKCKKCGEEKSFDLFYREPRNRDGHMGACKTCVDARTKKWQRDNKDKVREYNLKNHYGINHDEYLVMLAKQNGRCAICGTTEPGKPHFCVDHDHTSGAVRGLLCDDCNTALGKFNDETQRLHQAIQYLEKAKAA